MQNNAQFFSALGALSAILLGFLGITFSALRTISNVFQRSVEGLDGRFDTMDNRFNRMDDRFDRMDDRFDKVDARFDKVDERFGRLETRVGAVESELVSQRAEWQEQFTGVFRRLDAIELRTSAA